MHGWLPRLRGEAAGRTSGAGRGVKTNVATLWEVARGGSQRPTRNLMKQVRILPTLKRAFANACASDNGVTHGAIIFAFKTGETVDRLAEQHNLTRRQVEEILRAYMKR